MSDTEDLIAVLKANIEKNDNAKMSAIAERIPLLCKSVLDIHENIKEINNKLDNKFVSLDVFWPVKMIVYGAVGIALSGVLVTLLLLIHIHTQ